MVKMTGLAEGLAHVAPGQGPQEIANRRQHGPSLQEIRQNGETSEREDEALGLLALAQLESCVRAQRLEARERSDEVGEIANAGMPSAP
jgi:hypothetical protein